MAATARGGPERTRTDGPPALGGQPRVVVPLPVPLIGRERELGVLDAALARVGHTGAALIVRGEPGAGKSTLLAKCATTAVDRGMLVLRTVGVESEAQMPFAGLHLLLGRLAGQTERLPVAQRTALHSALGSSDTSPDVFLVALATLSLVGDAAASTPVLLVADDAQWLDSATCDVLAFLARRLEHESVVALIAVRDGYPTIFDAVDVPALRLDPLEAPAAEALLTARAPQLEPGVRLRVLAEAAGNPLALVELPLGLSSAPLDELPERLPLTARLEHAFMQRARQLPPRTQLVLAAAAINDGDQVVEALQGAAALSDAAPDVADLEPAESAGLVEVDGPLVRFRHPLVRSALAQAATTTERLRLHRSLAEVLSRSPDRRAWHLAASVVGPDALVARELEEAAERAVRRGGHAVAASALERAAALTDDLDERGARLLRAITLHHDLGRRDAVERLLYDVEGLELEPRLRWRLLWLRDFIEETHGRATVPQFVQLSDQAEQAGDRALAVDATLSAALKAYWFGADGDTRASVSAAVERRSVDDLDPKLLAALCLANPEVHGRDVVRLLDHAGVDAFADAEALRLVGIAMIGILEFDLAGQFLAAAVAGLREQGRMTVLARALGSQAHAALFTGDFALCQQAAEEGVRLTRETRQPRWEASCQIFLAQLSALRGEADRAKTLIAMGQRLLGVPQSAPGRQHVELAYAAACLSSGEPSDGYDRIARIFDPSDALHYPLLGIPGLVDFADAAVATGRVGEAREIVDGLEPIALGTGSAFVRTAIRDARAVLADDDSAEPRFKAALAERAGGPWRQARLNLSYGEWLRRRRRSADSRGPLRLARDLFDVLGAPPWSERARRELRASGVTSRRRKAETRDLLTPQELQIAQMVAEGLSNRDIAQQLFLSHRTVGSHLYRIFPKLGVATRYELTRVIRESSGVAGQPPPGG